MSILHTQKLITNSVIIIILYSNIIITEFAIFLFVYLNCTLVCTLISVDCNNYDNMFAIN